MVSPCVDVLRNLANRINEDLGTRQGKKHSSPDTKKDIEILMASLSKHEVYIEKEGRTLDPDEMPVPDAISVGLADLTHSSALADYNAQFERNRERRRLIPISTLLNISSNSNVLPSQTDTHPPNHTPNADIILHTPGSTSPNITAVVQHVTVEFPDSVAESSDNDGSDFGEDNIMKDDLKPTSLLLESEADVAMDMDTVMKYVEDDEYPWEEVLARYGSDSDVSTDRDRDGWESD